MEDDDGAGRFEREARHVDELLTALAAGDGNANVRVRDGSNGGADVGTTEIGGGVDNGTGSRTTCTF